MASRPRAVRHNLTSVFTRSRLRVEPLEGREVPAVLVGLTDGNALVTFDSDTPATTQSAVAVTGLGGETLVGIDYRGSNGQLYGVTDGSRLYTIDPTSGTASAVGTAAFTPALDGASFAVDFNPAVDKLRIISDTNQNLRINADSGAAAGTDAAPTFDAARYAEFFTDTPPDPQIVAAAYTKNLDPSGVTTVTTFYGIDANLDALVTIGGPEGDPSPNAGQVFIVDQFLDFDATSQTAFDIQPGTDTAFVASGTDLYSLNLTRAAISKVGTTTAAGNLIDVAFAPTATGAGTVSLPAATLAFPADRTPLVVTVTRAGGATGAASVDFATTDGTAVAGVDYLPTNGTLTFADGETTRTINLVLPAGTAAPSAEKTFTLTLSNATGSTLGTTTTTAVTIPAVTAPTTVTSFIAVASGSGTPQVVLFDSISGAKVASFTAYEGTFSSGVNVATGDVNGDGVDDVIVGSGSGGGPRVRVFDGATVTNATPTILADFFAYEDTFRGGVNVASGDVNGDGFDDLIIGSGDGGGPRVRVLDGETLTSGSQTSLADFFAYESTFRGGVNVGSGVFNADSTADVIAGAGIGGGPRVRVFDGATLAPLADYFAYDSTFRNGVLIATGDVNGDGRTDVVTGAGVGGGPNVRAFSGTTQTSLGSFFAFDQTQTGGVRVATTDFGADGTDDIVVGAGPGGSGVRVFNLAGTNLLTLNPFAASDTGGVFVG